MLYFYYLKSISNHCYVLINIFSNRILLLELLSDSKQIWFGLYPNRNIELFLKAQVFNSLCVNQYMVRFIFLKFINYVSYD